jgi:hypothetical protein
MRYEWEHAIADHAMDKAIGNDLMQSVFEAEMRTGDDLCTSHDFCPDVVKIDVEGHEHKVLIGLRETLSKHKPLLFIEVHPKDLVREGTTIRELLEFLSGLGYREVAVDGCCERPDELTRPLEIRRAVFAAT